MRQALSWSIERQALIDKEFGAVTFSPSVAASAIYSQGQSQYPGGGGTNPVGQATTTTTTPTRRRSGRLRELRGRDSKGERFREVAPRAGSATPARRW